MQRDSPDDLDDPVHQTQISVRIETAGQDELKAMVTDDASEWFEDKWDDKYGDWAIETGQTGGTVPDQYAHVFVYVEAERSTSEQLLGNWANRFIRSELQPNKGGNNVNGSDT